MRIGPNELHVKHPEAYDQVYRPGYKVSKWSWYYSCFGVGQSSFGSLNNVEHGQRRAAISSFFSRQSVLSLDDVLSRPINKLRNRLERVCSQGPKAWCQLERAYRCISLDSMSEIAFGKSFAFLDQEDCAQAFHDGVEDSLRTICVIRHFPLLVPVFNNMPLWVMRLAGEKLAAIRMMKEFARDAAKAALSKAPATSTRTILHEIVSNPDPRKTGLVTQRRLEEEALSLIAASSDTVGNALAAATYHLLRNPEANQRLVEELREAIPDAGSLREASPSYDTLAPLPWLVSGHPLSFGDTSDGANKTIEIDSCSKRIAENVSRFSWAATTTCSRLWYRGAGETYPWRSEYFLLCTLVRRWLQVTIFNYLDATHPPVTFLLWLIKCIWKIVCHFHECLPAAQ